MCIDLHQTGSIGEGSDRLQQIKFWPSCAPEKGSVTERKFLALPYYSQRAVFASLRALFLYYYASSQFYTHARTLTDYTLMRTGRQSKLGAVKPFFSNRSLLI